MEKRRIAPAGCPDVLGPYSPALAMGDMVFVSGQVAQGADGETVGPGDVAAQTRQALQNLEALVQAAGLTLQDVAMVQVYLPQVKRDFDAMNQVYQEFFSAPYPARVTVQAQLAEACYLVEIAAVAMRRAGG